MYDFKDIIMATGLYMYIRFNNEKLLNKICGFNKTRNEKDYDNNLTEISYISDLPLACGTVNISRETLFLINTVIFIH